MAGEQRVSRKPALIPLPGSPVSYRVEHHMHFTHGYVEVRRYLWSRPVDEDYTGERDFLVINMALTPRPAHTRIARLGQKERREAEDIGRILVLMPGSHFRSRPSMWCNFGGGLGSSSGGLCGYV